MSEEKNLYNVINKDIQEAMKGKDELRLETLRMMKNQVLQVNARGDLPEAEIIKLFSKYAKKLRESIEEFKKVGREDVVQKTQKEVAIVEAYLPKQLSEDELKAIIKQIIQETGASSQKDMGRVMKEVKTKAPQADGAVTSKIVRELLT